MNIYCLQMDIAWEDKAANFTKVHKMLQQSAVQPGSLVILPEMFATGFSMNKCGIGLDEPDRTETFLSNTAREFGVVLLGGLVSLADNGKGRNTCLVCDPEGNTIAHYQKIHPFTYGGETEHYIPGKKITLFEWDSFTVAPFICYDLRFPEIFRHAVQQGANLFCVIACWPAARQEHWLALLKARAIENQAYVAAVNRVGTDPKLAYTGRSQIIDPQGQILADGGEIETAIHTSLDYAALQQYRQAFPALGDIRHDYIYSQ